jgi:hypothetical protein
VKAVGLQSHHLGGGRAIAAVVIIAVALAAGNLIFSHDLERQGVAILLVGGALVVLSVLLGLRPNVREEPSRLVVQNLLRRAIIPWTSITSIEDDDVVIIVAGQLRVRCFALPRRRRRGTVGRLVDATGRMLPGDDDSRMDRINSSELVVLRLESQLASLRVGAPPESARVQVDPVSVMLVIIAVGCLVAAWIVGAGR